MLLVTTQEFNSQIFLHQNLSLELFKKLLSQREREREEKRGEKRNS